MRSLVTRLDEHMRTEPDRNTDAVDVTPASSTGLAGLQTPRVSRPSSENQTDPPKTDTDTGLADPFHLIDAAITD